MPEENWYCVRSQPSRQNVAAAHLRHLGIETFNPALRRRAATRAGVQNRTEPLFPNYLFARFQFDTRHRAVRYAIGVSGLITFGGAYAIVPEEEITRLRDTWGPSESLEIPQPIATGDHIALSGPLFHGMTAQVLFTMPAKQRVRVLLDFLGGPHEAEVSLSEIAPLLRHPLAA